MIGYRRRRKRFAAGIEVGDVEEQIDEPATNLSGEVKGFEQSMKTMQRKRPTDDLSKRDSGQVAEYDVLSYISRKGD